MTDPTWKQNIISMTIRLIPIQKTEISLKKEKYDTIFNIQRI
jgi:hypothetical protein